MQSLVSPRDGLQSNVSLAGAGSSAGAVSSAAVGLRRGIQFAATGLLGVLALTACGAGGDDTEGGVGTTENPNMPIEGVIDTSGMASGGMLLGDNCTGGNCSLGANVDVPTPLGCGDGVLAEDEACDDGNTVSGDGCSARCLIAESGFSCAEQGKPCRQIARCGDGLVAPTEQCDDGNLSVGDGCSERCRVEIGKKCANEPNGPSVCDDAICGNEVQEGAEACDDGNTDPFDGCSPLCLKEPNCETSPCTSECGDGLLIDEECDDGNLIDGDGCSSICTVEGGFICTEEAVCEEINGTCVIRVPAVFRDFSQAHPDFGGNELCTDLAPGALAPRLNAAGRPELSGNGALEQAACMSNAANFSEWYTSNASNQTVVGELLLFDNGAGGYVNRYGAQGEQFVAVDPGTELNTGTNSLAACSQTCVGRARDGQAPFQGQGNLRCDDQNVCGGLRDSIGQTRNGDLNRANDQLAQAQNGANPDPDEIAALEAAVEAVELEIAELVAQEAACQTDCQGELADRIASCSATCKPCGANPGQFCIGGEFLLFDGNPLFFPVDGITEVPANRVPATIPEQYGYANYPVESTIFPNAPDHNFYFTSEVQYWFPYNADTSATLNFLGDDDVWVYLNGVLAVDLGGIHVPSEGSIVIDAAAGVVTTSIQDGRLEANVLTGIGRTTVGTPADFNLEEGNVYTITIFHAERQIDGSSFQLTLAGFEATPSQCAAICGDGVLSFGEECDDGENNGGYNECGVGCVLGPFCGDGIIQGDSNENCDVGPGGDASCRGCRRSILQ